MKAYQSVAIVECYEPLIEIPDSIARVFPHPYQKLGAPYNGKSPFFLRETVLDRLIQADQNLQQIRPGWKIQVFDAYRPIAVQQFMVDYTFRELAHQQKLDLETLTEPQRADLYQQVYQFWAVPNYNPAMPPPHSTGAAIDVTLIDETGTAIDMGSEIDEISARSFPNHFAQSSDPQEQQYHQHRQILDRVMTDAGFKRHWNEWWHFSWGDQIWAWLTNRENCDQNAVAKLNEVTARYGRI